MRQEAERRTKLEAKQKKKERVQDKLEAERLAILALREARAQEARQAAEEKAAAAALDSERRAAMLSERLRDAEARRMQRLEEIKARAAVGKAVEREVCCRGRELTKGRFPCSEGDPVPIIWPFFFPFDPLREAGSAV